MKVVPKNPPGHALGWCVSRDSGSPPGEAGITACFFVKAAFTVTPSDAMTLDTSEAVLPTGDRPCHDPTLGLHYPSDFVPRKPCGEVMLVGTAYPPAGGFEVIRYPVRFEVGGWSKHLEVFGDRTWDTSGLFDKPGPAGQAGSVPLSYAYTWGGPEVPDNPLGYGPTGARVPPVETSRRPITGRGSKNKPACLGPISADWPQRKRHAGIPGAGGVRAWWPWAPPQFDERYWMATPEDQWVEGGLRGDEPVELINLHPERSSIRTTLPGLRARVFILRLPDDVPLSAASRGRLIDGEAMLEEVSLVLDTLHLDTDALRMTLLWRGCTPVRTPKLLDILGVSFGLEPLRENRDPQAYLAPLLAGESAPQPAVRDRAAIQADIDAAIAERKAAQVAVEAAMATQLATVKADVASKLAEARAGYDAAVNRFAAGFRPAEQAAVRAACVFLPTDPLATDPAVGGPSMEEVAADLRRQVGRAVTLPQGLPPAMQSQFLEATRQQAAAIMTSAAGLEEAAALQAGFMNRFEASKQALLATLPPELLVNRVIRPGDPIDLETIRRDGLSGFDLRGVDFSGFDLTGVSFRGVQAAGARFAGARLVGADFTQANLSEADLSAADLTAAVLEQTDLSAAVVTGAVWRETRLSGVNLSGLNLTAADFSGASGRHANFSSADLSGSCFRGATFDRPSFRAARTDRADFSAADLRLADFGSASCRGTVFTGAKLANLRAREAADFTAARLEGLQADDASWTTSILDGADFQGADLRRADFSECSLDGTNLDRCDLANANFSDSTLHATLMTDANLMRVSFDRATIIDVRFDGSTLFEAGFWDATLAGATFKESDVSRASLPPRS